MKSPIKNYTSSVPAARSIAHIEDQLIEHGATQIVKDYDASKRVSRLNFMIEVRQGDRMVPMYFRLPAQVSQCEAILRRRLGPRAKPATLKNMAEQAERTAWKIISDWTDAQMAMIDLAQVDLLEVLLAYVYNPGRGETLFETFKSQQFKGLNYEPKGK